VRGPVADAFPAGATLGVEHDGGVRGVPAVAVDRDDLAGGGGDTALEAVADAGDAGRRGSGFVGGPGVLAAAAFRRRGRRTLPG
jgi:hypothetical protein